MQSEEQTKQVKILLHPFLRYLYKKVQELAYSPFATTFYVEIFSIYIMHYMNKSTFSNITQLCYPFIS